MKRRLIAVGAILTLLMGGAAQVADACIDCHGKISPGQGDKKSLFSQVNSVAMKTNARNTSDTANHRFDFIQVITIAFLCLYQVSTTKTR